VLGFEGNAQKKKKRRLPSKVENYYLFSISLMHCFPSLQTKKKVLDSLELLSIYVWLNFFRASFYVYVH